MSNGAARVRLAPTAVVRAPGQAVASVDAAEGAPVATDTVDPLAPDCGGRFARGEARSGEAFRDRACRFTDEVGGRLGGGATDGRHFGHRQVGIGEST